MSGNGSTSPVAGSAEWGSVPTSPVTENENASVADDAPSLNGTATETVVATEEGTEGSEKQADKGKEKEKVAEKVAEEPQVKKFRGVPEDVKLFEVFWLQVVELIKVRHAECYAPA